MRVVRCPACNMADIIEDPVDGLHCPNCFYQPGPRRVGEQVPGAPTGKGRRKRPARFKSRKKAA
jgi:Zn ribbon nucleic-acid-binding protein